MPRLNLGDTSDARSIAGTALAYLDALRVRHFSEMTIAGKAHRLRYFILWCEERGIARPEDVTRAVVEAYQHWLALTYRSPSGKRLKAISQHGRLDAVVQYFRWMVRRGQLPFSPASDLEMPKLPKKLPRTGFTAEEAERVLAQADITTPMGLRDRALMEVLYSTGMRRMELACLRCASIDADSGTVCIREGKGRKDRVVPIGARAIAWVERYSTEARPAMVTPPDDGFLFLTNAGQPFSLDHLSGLVRTYIDAAKLDVGREGSCHLWRHTLATEMLRRGADIRVIQEILGHERLETTAIYTRVSIERLVAVHRATHPGNSHAGPVPATAQDVEVRELMAALKSDDDG